MSRALSYVEHLQGGGGTMMADGVRACLCFPHEESRLRYVAFLTDGFIGNEPDILREVHNNLGPSRIFSFGVGQSTNRYLLESMAKMGSGAAAFLSLNDSADDVMARFFDRISHPALANIAVDFGQLNASQVYPQRIPDLFVGRPVMLFGRFTGGGDTVVKVKGIVGGQSREISIPVNLNAASEHKAIPMLWARARIGDVLDEATWNPNPEFAAEVKRTALEYGIMSPFTAFLAVDATQRTAGDHGITVGVPVPVPDGVKYETTVQEKRPPTVERE